MHDHRHEKPPLLNAAADREAATTQERRVFWALLITGSFMVAEVVGGIVSGSLALLADAGHMLTDTGALALSWYAFRVSRRPATPLHSYGQHRFQVLAALINGATLIGIAVWIGIEAARRFFAPVEILGGTMLAVALAGLVANIAAFAILHGGSRDNLNVRGAALHVLGDLLGSAARQPGSRDRCRGRDLDHRLGTDRSTPVGACGLAHCPQRVGADHQVLARPDGRNPSRDRHWVP